MNLEKKTATHKIFKRNDGRYAVKTLKGQAVNAEEKIAILLAEGMVTAPKPKAAAEPEVEVEETAEAEEPVAEEAAVEEPAAEEAAPVEEAPAVEEAAVEEPAAEEAAPAEDADEAPAKAEKKKD